MKRRSRGLVARSFEAAAHHIAPRQEKPLQGRNLDPGKWPYAAK
jgi:hypothetical protein